MGAASNRRSSSRLWTRISAQRERVAASFFLVPVLFMVGGIVLGQLGITLDARLDINARNAPLGVASTVESARAVLTTVATATVTVAGIALSVSILTLQLASSQYSPRVVSGLFRDPFNKRVIGTVLGTFAYCLVVLRAVHAPIEGVGQAAIPTVSVTFGLLLGLIALLAVVAFINHNAHTMDVSQILAIVSKAAKSGTADPTTSALEPSPVQQPDVVPSGDAFVVRSESDGWVQLVDAAALLSTAPDGSTIRLDTAVGRYVLCQSPLCTVWPRPKHPDEVESGLRSAVKVGATRTLQHDEAYGLRQLADVALKALSPGINDPTTAQDAILHLTSVLRDLLARPAPPRDVREDSRRLVLPHGSGPAEWINLSFDEIRLAAASQPAVCVYLIESIALLLQSGAAEDPDVELLLRHHADLVVGACKRTDPAPEDLQRLLDVFVATLGADGPISPSASV